MNTPSKIYLDPRVAMTLKPEPDPDKLDRNIKELCYISVERATELVRDAQEKAQASIPAEYVVQLQANQSWAPVMGGETAPGAPLVLALTNLGRIFQAIGDNDWLELPGPIQPTEPGS